MIRPLTHEEWRARKAKLDALGGTCDVRSWQDPFPAERAQLRQPPQRRRLPPEMNPHYCAGRLEDKSAYKGSRLAGNLSLSAELRY